MGDKKIVGILPNQYVHVLDLVSGNSYVMNVRVMSHSLALAMPARTIELCVFR